MKIVRTWTMTAGDNALSHAIWVTFGDDAYGCLGTGATKGEAIASAIAELRDALDELAGSLSDTPSLSVPTGAREIRIDLTAEDRPL